MNNEQKENVTPIIVPAYSEEKTEHKLLSRMKRFKNKLKRKAVEKKEKKEKVLRQTPDLLPFLKKEDECIVMKNGVMDILQISSKDLYSMSDEELKILLYSQARFMRSYYHPYKEVALNFPSNTQKQKNYWLKKREQTTDSLRLKFIDRKIFELDFLEKERTNREFFLFLYAENREQLEERKKQIIRSMQHVFPLKPLSFEKKQDVLFMLNNQNTKL